LLPVDAHSTRHDPQALPTGGTATRNGPASLSERVQSLRLPERHGAAASWRTFLPWFLCLLLAAGAAYLYYLREQEQGHVPAAAPGATEAGSALPGIAGPARAAAPGEVIQQLKGNITPIRLIQVSPKISGMVISLKFKEGDVVKEGDVLARLEDVEYDSDYKHCIAAKAAAERRWKELTEYRDQEIDQTRAELDEAKALLEQLALDFKRSIPLRGQALSTKDYEQAEYAYRSQDRRVERLKLAYDMMKKGPRDEKIAAAKADYDAAHADVVKARWRLDNCTVRSPMAGIILTKKAEEGNIVNPVAFNIAAMLCEMADLTELEVDLRVPERDIARVLWPERDPAKKVWRRQRCQVIAEGYPDRPYEGYVSRVMPQADRGNAAVPVRVRIRIPRAEAGQYLRPDMGALVRFLNERVETPD
jgi:multidrug efflux pump subunit AcrA (membrane-fusion protein)